jgi:hypothetical protein
MTRMRKRDVRRAIAGAREMLERNASTIDTFEGILSRGYVRDLRTLVQLGERFLASRDFVPLQRPRAD